MSIQGLTLKQSMSKNIQAIMPQEDDKLVFEANLVGFLENLYAKPEESEEFQKNLLKDFLKECFPNNFINTIERTDLAIYNGPSPESTVGILIESKSLKNKSEMMSKVNYNTKAFQEIIHYYLNERLIRKNLEVKKCIITNGLEWFVIEAKEIEKHFVKNKKLIDLYNKWRLAQLSSVKTDFLFKEVIAPAIDKAINDGLILAHFDLRNALKQNKKIEIQQNKLTQLYRFFTPENLLNKEIFADSNKLNKGFYDELLFLMGLEEIKVDNKKIIQRLPANKRQLGSFVENVVDRLQMNDVPTEKQQEIAIQLTVVWVNRILFLKLLESQLIAFNGEEKYKFLTKNLLPTFDDIYYLFFGVLAKKVHQRSSEMQEKFPQIPYLNSSLFEETELEISRDGLGIDRLREHQITFYSKTILKGKDGKRKTGKVEFLTYLFDFLSAYDFSTSVRHNKKDKNNLINAAVLGLIFEKINGYREGSFYTPGRITMYMSRKIIRDAVVEKINEIKRWNCKNIYEVQFNITSLDDAKEINKIINTLKICDPAVGSGHFLVSVLNELIAIKSELRVLIDHEERSMNDIRCTVVNDELIIQDFNGDNFTYKRGNPESERIQKAIFLEKRKLIENCLFGVDINPNSANICRLRLWIELLKNSYYYLEKESKTQQLITLPNIDINIKVGNSLLHKFRVDDSLDKRFSQIKNYTQLVSDYKSTNNKRKKQDIINQIDQIKLNFLSSIETPELRKVKRLNSNLAKVGQIDLFASKEDVKKQREEILEIEKKLNKAMADLEHSRQNPLFRKGLEWRMEFPEILDDDGNFVGFDVVIANPPYIYSSEGVFSTSEKRYFEQEYPLSKYQANTFGLFLELSFKILRKNGLYSMIIPNTFLTIGQYNTMRRYILENTGDVFILNSHDKIFEDASVDNCIISGKISSPSLVELAELQNEEVNVIKKVGPNELLKHQVFNLSVFKEGKNPLDISTIIKSIEDNSKILEPNYAIVRDGLKVYQKGKGEPKQTHDDNDFKKLKKDRDWFSPLKVDKNYWEIIKGEHIDRFKIFRGKEYIRYGRHLAEPRNPEMFMGERLLIRQIPRKAAYSLTVMHTDKPIMHERSLIAIRNLKINSYFILGVLNSKVESYYAIHKYDFLQRKTFPQLRLYQIKELPIPNATQEEQVHLSNLVEKQIALHTTSLPTENEREEMTNLDHAINEYVMDLYKLNQEEKQVIRDFKIE
ncbi:type II restriction endonuclease [Fictibacillus arsenicus]|uniref:site-specific DNA-methyltransferase (adenine-specific) n=1 Tax=Fictibacillus arsenicus TaxID=255247 RepID=A0A1B1Z7B5_9BACL|nr:TaqI-like C-terminal specificity domain-containing protein [Fictibacillus arsenicus]ANX13322.1 type II restriction endonuclease [Fictibacillus arsenicus]